MIYVFWGPHNERANSFPSPVEDGPQYTCADTNKYWNEELKETAPPVAADEQIVRSGTLTRPSKYCEIMKMINAYVSVVYNSLCENA